MVLSDPVFRSKLRDDLEAFISQKRASGYPYHTSSKVLGYLDTMIAEDYPDCSTLSKEICDAWIRKCSVLHQNTLLRRVTPVRQFAKYLVGTGKNRCDYIPSAAGGCWECHYGLYPERTPHRSKKESICFREEAGTL